MLLTSLITQNGNWRRNALAEGSRLLLLLLLVGVADGAGGVVLLLLLIISYCCTAGVGVGVVGGGV